MRPVRKRWIVLLLAASLVTVSAPALAAGGSTTVTGTSDGVKACSTQNVDGETVQVCRTATYPVPVPEEVQEATNEVWSEAVDATGLAWSTAGQAIAEAFGLSTEAIEKVWTISTDSVGDAWGIATLAIDEGWEVTEYVVSHAWDEVSDAASGP